MDVRPTEGNQDAAGPCRGGNGFRGVFRGAVLGGGMPTNWHLGRDRPLLQVKHFLHHGEAFAVGLVGHRFE